MKLFSLEYIGGGGAVGAKDKEEDENGAIAVTWREEG